MDLQSAIDGAVAMKESDWEDLLPVLHLEFQDGSHVIIALPEFSGGDEGVLMLGSCLVQQRFERGELKNLVFINDARMRELKEGQERPPNDNLQEKWDAGDRDGITEVVLLHHMDEKGKYVHVNMPYDAEARTWGEQIIADEEDPDSQQRAGGRIIDTLRLAGFSIHIDGSKATELDDFIAEGRATHD